MKLLNWFRRGGPSYLRVILFSLAPSVFLVAEHSINHFVYQTSYCRWNECCKNQLFLSIRITKSNRMILSRPVLLIKMSYLISCSLSFSIALVTDWLRSNNSFMLILLELSGCDFCQYHGIQNKRIARCPVLE